MPNNSPLIIKLLLLAVVSLALALLYELLELPFIVIAATEFCLLLLAFADITLGGAFLILISLHVVLGYLGMVRVASVLVEPGNNAIVFMTNSLEIFSVGICSAILTYGLIGRKTATLRTLNINVSRLQTAAIYVALAGSSLLLFIVNRVGLLDMLASDSLVRYFGELEAGPNYMLYQSLLRRGLAVTAAALPVLLLRWQETKALTLFAVAAVSIAAMAITFRRGNLTIACLTFVITSFVLGRNRRGMLIGVLVLAIAFIFLQAMFVNLPIELEGPVGRTAFLASIGISEVRDFAYILSEWNHRYFYGATWLAAIWPAPAAVSNFKDNNVLSYVTLDIVGRARESNHGGFRILEFGESYLNFGYIGVIFAGVLFGVLLRVVNGVVASAKRQQSPILLACVYVFLLFICQLYVSGSAILSDAALTISTLFAMYFFASERGGQPHRAHEQKPRALVRNGMPPGRAC